MFPWRLALDIRHLIPQRLLAQRGHQLRQVVRPMETTKQWLEIQVERSRGW